jgi:hypothetical protein
MKMHHRFDVQRVGLHAINDRVGETPEIEFAVFAANFAPAFGPGQNTT